MINNKCLARQPMKGPDFTYVLRHRGGRSCGQYRGDILSSSRYSRSLQPAFVTYRSFPNSSRCWVDSGPIHWPKFPEKISSPRETRTSARPVVQSQDMMRCWTLKIMIMKNTRFRKKALFCSPCVRVNRNIFITISFERIERS